MKARLKARTDRGDLVRLLAALSDEEWQTLADEARAESLIPLAHLVIEGLGADIGALTAKLSGRIVIDDVGRSCCTRATARELFDERETYRQKLRDRAAKERAEAQARGNPTHDWVRALQAAQKDRPGLLRAEEDT